MSRIKFLLMALRIKLGEKSLKKQWLEVVQENMRKKCNKKRTSGGKAVNTRPVFLNIFFKFRSTFPLIAKFHSMDVKNFRAT